MPGAAALIMRLLPIAVALRLLAGCEISPEPFEYHSDTEIPQGPGLLSGEDGEFVLFRK